MSNRHLNTDIRDYSAPRRARGAWLAAAALALAIGCGGSSQKGSTTAGGKALPGAGVVGSDKSRKPKRTISKDARQDYRAAMEFFQQQETAGWNSDRCESAAEKFTDVAKDHPKLVEAPYMAGVSYHRCNRYDDAARAYQSALAVDRAHALSISNLGELYFQQGKVDDAKQAWENALKADTKIVAARNNLAWLILEKMRATKPWSGEWKRLESQAREQLSASLAVDTDSVKTYVLYALVYMEGAERNKSRLDLARLLLDEGSKRSKEYAPLYNARGLLAMKRNNQVVALQNFVKAVELDGNLAEARMNVGNITLGFRKYEAAEAEFSKVIELQPQNYDAMIGLGVAQRGLGKLDAAEASYTKATQLDGSRGAAYFNLGVLYKDFRANNANDLKTSQAAYQKAREYFNSYLAKSDATKASKKEAKANIADCDKIIKQLGEVMKAMAQDGSAGG